MKFLLSPYNILLLSPPTDTWAVFISVAAVLVSVGGIAFSAYWQQRLEHRRLKQELFELRYDLYKNLLNLSELSSLGSLNRESELKQYISLLDKAQFLFTRRTMDALQLYREVQQNVSESLDKFIARATFGKEPMSDPDVAYWWGRALGAQIFLNKAIEAELMLVDNRPPWRRRICSWVDRSEAESNDGARKRVGLNP